MRTFKIIIIIVFASINCKSQTKIIQSIERTRNDSCIIFTKLETKEGKSFKSQVKCKFLEFDSLKLIERKRAKIISENFNWKN